MNEQITGGRTVVLDTETTGLDAKNGHRIIELGCVELQERRLTGNNLHLYFQPDREIDAGAFAVHGISNEFLGDKPRFAQKASEILDYLKGAELIIHNADFDVGFLEHEFTLCDMPLSISDICKVTDSLQMARKQFPGQRATLDSLQKKFGVRGIDRTLHGALLDSEILAQVYLAMTGGQTAMSLDENAETDANRLSLDQNIDVSKLAVIKATEEELAAHEQWLDTLRKESEACCWDQMETNQAH